jgi:hypothetical protein
MDKTVRRVRDPLALAELAAKASGMREGGLGPLAHGFVLYEPFEGLIEPKRQSPVVHF